MEKWTFKLSKWTFEKDSIELVFLLFVCIYYLFIYQSGLMDFTFCKKQKKKRIFKNEKAILFYGFIKNKSPLFHFFVFLYMFSNILLLF